MDLARVLGFLHERQSRGSQAVLVTVCSVEGSSMRNPGSVMCVADDGTFAGSLSGGCIENAVVAEALDALKEGVARIVRFGAGSTYLDIKLPCGGGLDLHFQPLVESDFAALCRASIDSRAPFSILLGESGPRHVPQWQRTAWDEDSGKGAFGHWPAPRLLIVGHGAGVPALAAIAASMDCEVAVLTPDNRTENELRTQVVAVQRLDRTGQIELLTSDPWTAIVFLFHDHDWEIELMAHALKLPHFYLGAMGGRHAHAMRCEALANLGITADQLAGVRAPIGVFHSSRDPQTLALSTLAEVIRTYQETDFEAVLG